MVDALEAERSASKKKATPSDKEGFVCEPAIEEPKRGRRRRPQKPANESTP
jgi:hypothetical protein